MNFYAYYIGYIGIYILPQITCGIFEDCFKWEFVFQIRWIKWEVGIKKVILIKYNYKE